MARRRLAWAALAAGVGIGLGSAAHRLTERRARIRWSPPSGTMHHGALAARVLGDAGPAVVLLHGLSGSNRVWGAAFDALADDCRLVVPDLLGFGASPRPWSEYGGAEHADAIAGCMEELGLGDRPAVVGAHSMGAVVALHLARRHPGLVGAIVAFGPALFASRADAKNHIAALGPMARAFARDTAVARRACTWVCEHRGAAAVVATVLRPDLPAQLARDGVQHTWESYSQSLERVILDADAVPLVEAANVPIGFVAGGRDRVPDIPLLERLAVAHDHVTLAIWPDDDHDLLLTSPDRALDELRNALTRRPDAPAPV